MAKLRKEVFAEQMKRLALCFPKSTPELTTELLDVWYGELKNFDEGLFVCCVDWIIQESSYFPTIAAFFKASTETRRTGRWL